MDLTASPCCTTNTIHTTVPDREIESEIETDRQTDRQRIMWDGGVGGGGG